ncbi:MAG: hypothetical protein IT162_13975 [Bryobacterales bacterium]|nr:hypothetical protein [Bryobacterales bacterium]
MTRRRALAAAAVVLCAAAAAAEAPFWESKPPSQWTREQIESLFTLSPWGMLALDTTTPIFLASARPLREAEVQLRTRGAAEGQAEAQADEDDYFSYIAQNPGKHIVVAARVADLTAFSEAREVKQMEKECYLRAGGRKKIFPVGHFPPTPSDPYLRILFPRQSLDGVKTVNVLLYVPGNSKPFMEAEFKVKDLMYRGKLEY